MKKNNKSADCLYKFYFIHSALSSSNRDPVHNTIDTRVSAMHCQHSATYLPICCPSLYLLFPRREECGFWTLLSLVNKLPSLRDVQNLTFV